MNYMYRTVISSIDVIFVTIEIALVTVAWNCSGVDSMMSFVSTRPPVLQGITTIFSFLFQQGEVT